MPATLHDPHVRFVDLDHDQLLVLADRRGTRIDVLFGGIWLTEENSPQDRIVEAGQSWLLRRRGRAVIESLGRSGLRISEPVRGFAGRLRPLLERLAARRGALSAHAGAALLSLLLGVGLVELSAGGFGRPVGPTHAIVASVLSAPA